LKKETILVLASTFPRWKNDKEPRFIYDLCIRLTNNYNIILLTSHYENTKKIETLENIQVIRYKYAPEKLEKLVYNGGITTNLKQSLWKWLLVPSFFIVQLVTIIKLLKYHPIKLIHAHWLIPQSFLAVLALKISNKTQIPLLCTSHGGDLFGLQDKISLKIKRWVIKHSSSLTVVSNAMLIPLQQLNSQSINKTHVIPMGTDLTYQFIPRKNISRQSSMLLFAGRLVEKKGVDILIRAIPEVLEKHSDIQLFIAGDGPEKKYLKKISKKLKLEQTIHFIGKQSHNELSILYNKATITIFPFQQAKDGDIEGLGLVVIEALGCGCPVIAGNVPAVHDTIKDNITGIISEHKNSKRLAINIIKLLNSPEKRSSLAHNGREYAIKHFSWEVSSHLYNQTIQKLIKNNS